MRTRNVTAGMLSKVVWPTELPGGKPMLLFPAESPQQARDLVPVFQGLLAKYKLQNIFRVYEAPITHTKGPQTHGIMLDMLNRAPADQLATDVGDQLAEEIEDYRVKRYLGVA